MIVTEFCENLKVVPPGFSMIKNMVAPFVAKVVPVKLICCGSFNLVCLLKSTAIVCNFLRNKQNLTN